jgi:hypothetical protein
MKAIALVLIVLGVLALVYGGFTYTRQTAEVDLGPLALEVRERERVHVPLWLGAAAVGLGALLLVVEASRRR